MTPKNLDQMSESEIYALYDQEMSKSQGQSSPKSLDQMSEQEVYALYDSEMNKKQDQGRPVQAAIEGFGQGASFGYLPHLQAAAGALMPDPTSGIDAQLETQGFSIDQPADTYLSRRDANIQRQADLQAENPSAYLGGNIAGAISTGIALPGSGVAKGAGFFSKVGNAAKVGGLYGLLQNPGDTQGEISPLQIQDRGINALKGAATGAVVGSTVEGLAKGYQAIKAAPEALKKTAAGAALKSTGAMLKDFRKAMGRGVSDRIGRRLIDDNVVKFGDTFDDIASAASVQRDKIAGELNDLYAVTDDAIAKATPEQAAALEGTKLDARKIAQDLKNDMEKAAQGNLGLTETNRKVFSLLDEFAENGELTVSRLRELRGQVDELVNWSKQTSDMPSFQRELVNVRNNLNKQIEARLDAANKVFGGEGSKRLKALNEAYSDYAEVSKIAADRMARESANRMLSLGDRQAGQVGAMAGIGMAGGAGPLVGALATSLVSKLARQRGGAMLARTADSTANLMMKTPEALGKYSEPLIKAMSESPGAFVKAVQAFRAKDPEFRQMISAPELSAPGRMDLAKESNSSRNPSGGKR